jgi:hypothetical protein
LVLVAAALAGCARNSATATPIQMTPVMLPAGTAAPRTATTAAASVAQATTAAAPATPAATAALAAATAVPSSGGSTMRVMALGNRAATTLRARAEAGAGVVTTLPGSAVVFAEGRSADGRWLYVAYGENGARAWADSRELTLFGDKDSLPVTAEEARAAERQNAAAAPGTPAPPKGAISGRVAAQSSINVRGGPGTDRPVLAGLPAGTAVTAVGRNQDGTWLSITWSGGQGWVAASLIALDGQAQSLPAVSAPAAASAPAPAAAAPQPGGRIALQTRMGGDIYVLNADGSGMRRVTTGLDPAWSPDGTRLAYVRWGSPEAEVFVLDLRSGEEKRVAGASQARAPTWSADGQALTFARITSSSSCYATPFGCFSPSDPPFAGRDCIQVPRIGQICLSSYPKRDVDVTGLTQVMLAGGAWLDVPSEPSPQSPAWRPGFPQLLYRNEKGLQLLEDRSSRLLLADAQANSPAWSPDGQRIAFQAHVHDHSDIFVVDAGGGGRTALTQREPLATRAVNNVAPAWSPDGRQILFLTDRDGAWRLYVMNADGSGQRPFLPAVLGSLALNYEFAAERVVAWTR